MRVKRSSMTGVTETVRPRRSTLRSSSRFCTGTALQTPQDFGDVGRPADPPDCVLLDGGNCTVSKESATKADLAP